MSGAVDRRAYRRDVGHRSGRGLVVDDADGLDRLRPVRGEAPRRAVRAGGLEIQCAEPADYRSVRTGVVMPEGHSADAFRRIVLERYDMSLGQGLGRLSGKVFRIGHLGWFNDLMLCGTLAGVAMGLALAGVPHRKGGVDAAMGYLVDASPRALPRAA